MKFGIFLVYEGEYKIDPYSAVARQKDSNQLPIVFVLSGVDQKVFKRILTKEVSRSRCFSYLKYSCVKLCPLSWKEKLKMAKDSNVPPIVWLLAETLSVVFFRKN